MKQDRKDFIGGSDIASVMGFSRAKTPLQLWAEKAGEVEPADLSEVEAVEMGHELEETVARLFTKRTGLKVRRAPKNYVYSSKATGELPYFRCQVDRLVQGTDELLECKTCSAWKLKEWDDEEIPTEYILQVMWQLGITGRSVGHIAVLIGGQTFKYKKIDFDPSLFDDMIKQALVFWLMVEYKTPPMATGDDNKFMVDLYPDNEEQMQQLDELNDSVALRQQLKGTLAETQEQINEVEARIKQVIGDNLGFTTQEYKVTWKTQVSNRIDTKLIKEEQPEIYNRYVFPSKSRVLRITKNK